MSEENARADGVVEITCDFVRHRNVLLTGGDLRPLLERWHRHHDANSLHLDPGHAAMFENALAAFVLHLAGQSRNRHMTWTINIGSPAINLFLGGDTHTGGVTGRVFTEDVATFPKGQFYQEAIVGGKGPFRSHATFVSHDVFEAVEQYYAMSEQRPAKLFDLGECRFVMAHAHPDYDEGWFTHLKADSVREIAAREELGRIETRAFGWHCGCEERSRLLRALLPTFLKQPAELFGEELTLELACPRCAGRHTIALSEMQAFAANESGRPPGRA